MVKTTSWPRQDPQRTAIHVEVVLGTQAVHERAVCPAAPNQGLSVLCVSVLQQRRWRCYSPTSVGAEGCTSRSQHTVSCWLAVFYGLELRLIREQYQFTNTLKKKKNLQINVTCSKKHIFAYYICIIVSFMKRFTEHHKSYTLQITATSPEGEPQVTRHSTKSKMQNLRAAKSSLRGDSWSPHRRRQNLFSAGATQSWRVPFQSVWIFKACLCWTRLLLSLLIFVLASALYDRPVCMTGDFSAFIKIEQGD